jgi:ubiquinone/menaquinone biosynthesis C-methylase UbiE
MPLSGRFNHCFADGTYGVRVADAGGSIVWDEVARLYGEGASPFGVLSEELVKRAALCQGDRVVDVGAGNGWGLVPAARTVAPSLAVGLDFSAQMLAVARERSDAAGLHNVRLVQGDARYPGLADRAFDVVLASSVFQFVGYAPDVLAQWRQLLRPGGRLVFSVPAPDDAPVFGLLNDLLTEYLADLPPELADRVSRTRPDPPDLSALCLATGFQRATVEQVRCAVVLREPEHWWQIQWSHGARSLLRVVDPSTLRAMESEALERLESLKDEQGTIPFDLTMTLCIALV